MEGENNKQIISKEEMDKHYVWNIFYYNPDDDRAIVPKRCKWMGWTINFANRKGQFIIGSTLAALAAIYAYCYKNDKKMHYSFSELYDMIKNKFSN